MEEFHDLWNQFDTGEIDKLNLAKNNLCQKMLELVEGAKKEEIRLELSLLWFIFILQQMLEHFDNVTLDKLTPEIEQLIQKSDEKTLGYYKKRHDETKSTLNKWRYSLACWLMMPKKNPVFLDDAINSLISSSQKHMKEKEYGDTIHLLVSAFNLAKVYNFTKNNSKISDVALEVFYNVANTTNARWMIEPAEIFAHLSKQADYNLVNNMITILHKEADRFHKKNSHHLQQSLLEVSVNLCSFTNLDTDLREKLKKEIRTMIAESHEDDANKRFESENPMAAVSFYKEAQTEYERAGNHQKAEDLNEKIRQATRNIQYNEFKYKIVLPELKLAGNNGYELVISFCDNNDNIPSIQDVTNLTKDLMKQNPISSMFSNVTFNKNNPVSYANDTKSILESRIKQQTIWRIRLTENRLALEVKKLEEEKKITESDFVMFLTDTGLYDNDQLTIIKSGISDHFRGNYISSVHTLIPQVEGTLRLLLKMKGVSTLKTKRDIIMDSELGSLLAKPEVVKIIGEDFTNYIKTKYSDPDGINLRNNVSHALSSLSDFKYETSITLIQTIFKLAKLSVKQ